MTWTVEGYAKMRKLKYRRFAASIFTLICILLLFSPICDKKEINFCSALCANGINKNQMECVERLVEHKTKFNSELSVYKSDNIMEKSDTLFAGLIQSTFFIRIANVTKAEFINVGTQPKLLLQLDNSKSVLFKPKWYSSRWKTENACSSFDRHSGEIVAYHLSLILGFVTVSPTCGRVLDMEKDIVSVGGTQFSSSFYRNRNKRLCMKLPCKYCQAPMCSLEDGTIRGSFSLWMNKSFQSLENPWGATCTQQSEQHWLDNPSYCSSILKNETFSRNNLYLDIIDISIFDFLIDNVDRHHLQYDITLDGRFKFILFDNGKSLANPDKDHIHLLAPLYQCCTIKKDTFIILEKLFKKQLLSRLLNESIKFDQLYQDIANDHYLAIDRRLGKVIAIVKTCIDFNHINKVLA